MRPWHQAYLPLSTAMRKTVSAGGSVSVSAVQQTTTGAVAEGSGSAYSVVTGQGANISATAAAQVSSIIGEGATIFAPGVVSITANGTNIATSDAGSIGGRHSTCRRSLQMPRRTAPMMLFLVAALNLETTPWWGPQQTRMEAWSCPRPARISPRLLWI